MDLSEIKYCGKVCFKKADALAAIRNIQHRGKQHSKEKRTYFCSQCKSWHLTSQDKIKDNSKPVKLSFKEEWDKLR